MFACCYFNPRVSVLLLQTGPTTTMKRILATARGRSSSVQQPLQQLTALAMLVSLAAAAVGPMQVQQQVLLLIHPETYLMMTPTCLCRPASQQLVQILAGCSAEKDQQQRVRQVARRKS